MTPPTTARRWFHLTPDRCLILLLALESILLLSERFHWFAFNEKKGYTVLIAVASVGIAGILMGLWFAASLLFRWRFQFSIRSLLVLVVVIAIPCSWLALEMEEAKGQRRAVDAIEKGGGVAWYDYEFDNPGNRIKAEPPAPAWLRNLLGDDFFSNPTFAGFSFTDFADAGLMNIKGLTQLQRLYLVGPKITDSGLLNLTGMTQLQILDLEQTSVTNAGVKKLQQTLPNCVIILK